MNAPRYSIIIFIAFFNGLSFSSIRYSEDQIDIYKIIRCIGSPISGTSDIYFIRPNLNVSLDSATMIIKGLLLDQVDSITRPDRTIFKCCDIDSSQKQVYRLSYGLIINGLFSRKYFSLNLFMDTVDEIIGVSSLKWQNGFIEPWEKNNSFAKRVKRLFLNQYKSAEYIGKSELKCSINDNSGLFSSGEAQFWKWFKRYEKYLYDYDANKTRIDKALIRKLKLIDYDLSFEISPVKDNKRELKIIGSDYLKSRILKSSSNLHYWKIKFENRKREIQ